MIDMSAADHHSVLLIGGPDAGKSNFLFRLWIAIDGGGGVLVKDGLPSDLEYLRAGAERLLEGEFAKHTPTEVYERVVVPVRSSSRVAPSRGMLVVPDLAGEQILAVCRSRQWSQTWEELISPRCACLLFVRAGSKENVAPLEWATCFEKYGAVLQPPHEEQSHGSQGVDPVDSEESQEAPGKGAPLPTQVILTEWLQFLRLAFTAVAGGLFRPRVGVVVSAWDLVPSDQQPAGPLEYVGENFPMLHQFIQANGERFDFQVFGVSIVAGDLEHDEAFKETYLNGQPREFGFVFHSLSGLPSSSPDITLPIAWALGMLGETS